MGARNIEARLYCEVDLCDGELHTLGPGLASVYTTRCPQKSTVNEDSSAIIPYNGESGVLVIADGAGGRPSGAKASALAVNAIKTSLQKGADNRDDLRVAILDGIELANAHVGDLGIGAATTLAIAEISRDQMRPYHVGDSQIMIIGRKGKLKLQTTSHSPVGYALEAGLIDEAEAMHHEERHLISNMIGSPDMRIEVGSAIPLAPNDTVIVGSDGLFDNLHTEEIIDTCRKGQLLGISRMLAKQCLERMGDAKAGAPSKPDDLTFITFRRRVTTD